MAQFDALVGDVAGRFNLGANANSLVQEILRLITGSPGGIGGFLDRFKSAGLGSEVKTWLGHPDASPLLANQVDRALGSNTLGMIASKLGIGVSAASAIAGYTIPKLIGALTSGGIIPSKLSSDVLSFLSPSSRTQQVPPLRVSVIRDDEEPKARGGWFWPLLAVLGAALLGFYLFSHQPAISPSIVEAPVQPAALFPPWLALSNDNGVVHYTGTVHDEAARASILNALTAAFGASNIQGSIGSDPNRAAASWTGNLRAALDNLRVPGTQAVFDGNSFGLGGIAEAERNRIFASMKSIYGSALKLGTLDDIVSGANSRVMAALAALRAGFSTSDLTGILNQSTINFASGESQVPAAAMGLLASAAAQIKRLPANTVLEISGYTDNVGDPSANLTLSQQRADTVRSELVRNGVAASMLVAKGYGEAKPIASNDSAEGRFRNRRIEYHVVQP